MFAKNIFTLLLYHLFNSKYNILYAEQFCLKLNHLNNGRDTNGIDCP